MRSLSGTFRALILLLITSPILSAQNPLSAESPGLTGLFLDIHYTHTPGFDVRMGGYTTTGSDSTFIEPHDGGGGFGIFIGWGIVDWLGVYGGFDFTGHDIIGGRYNHGSVFHAELGLRLQVPMDGLTPYASVAYGSRIFSMSNTSQSGNTIFVYDELSDVGASTLSYGGGLRIFVFDLSYMVSSASYPDERIESFSTSRFRLGISMYIDLN